MFKVVSGGQTGIDRMALDVAIELKLAHGGWCPRGRRAEDGIIPVIYQLKETASRNYALRTERNIVDSDGTLVLFGSSVSGGTELTIKLCKRHEKPLLVIGLESLTGQLFSAEDNSVDWLKQNDIMVLNVAGPRESTQPELSARVKPLFRNVIQSYVKHLSQTE